MRLFAATLEYAPSTRIDGEQIVYTRLKVICEADGLTLWEGVDDVDQELAENDIFVTFSKRIDSDYIARIDTDKTDISAFVEWTPNVKTDSLCVRTFYTIMNKDKNDLFGSDSTWNTTFLGDRSLADWYSALEAKV